jgi:hypothetical protein
VLGNPVLRKIIQPKRYVQRGCRWYVSKNVMEVIMCWTHSFNMENKKVYRILLRQPLGK